MYRVISLLRVRLSVRRFFTTRALVIAALLLTAAAVLLVFGAKPVHAQAPDTLSPVLDGGLKADHRDAFISIPAPIPAGKLDDLATATIQVNFNGTWPPEAQAAFQYAADIWETHISSPVVIRVDATWEALGENTLGSAGPYITVPSAAPGIVPNTIYPVPIAEAILGRSINVDGTDIDAAFSSEFTNWYYGLDARPPAGTFDFVTVVLHELGHGLGFTGSFAVEDADPEEDVCDVPAAPGQGCWGYDLRPGSTSPIYPFIFDRFTEDADEIPLLNTAVYPNPSDKLGDVLESRAFYSSERSRRLNRDVPILLYSPAAFEGGSSFSHLDEASFNGTLEALMTPSLARAEAIHLPGGITCAIMGDMGWPLGPSCLQFLPTPNEEPSHLALTVRPAHPNPFADRTELLISVEQPQRVRIEVYDVTGRRVAAQPERLVTPNTPERITLEGAGWPPGLYLVRLTGETFTHTEKVVRVR